ncbi:MAG TPA: hypothetical protein VFH21_05575 [Burkholderiales bacterium]|nr:hypothetical protein [Burkholderiales bacterium]
MGGAEKSSSIAAEYSCFPGASSYPPLSLHIFHIAPYRFERDELFLDLPHHFDREPPDEKSCFAFLLDLQGHFPGALTMRHERMSGTKSAR